MRKWPGKRDHPPCCRSSDALFYNSVIPRFNPVAYGTGAVLHGISFGHSVRYFGSGYVRGGIETLVTSDIDPLPPKQPGV